MHGRPPQPRPNDNRLMRWVVRGCSGLGVLLLLITLSPLVPWWSKAMAGNWSTPKGEILIVPGGALLPDQILAESSYWRAVYAVRVYRQDHPRQILFSGGFQLAEAMRDFAASSGVPPEVLRTENGSRTTRENALYAKELVGAQPGTKVLLTSDYHMYRARRTFEKLGIPVQPYPVPDALKRSASWKGRWPAFLDLSLETVKIGYYRVRGWI
jgi:uncharacterized SAM-binding protein YcdF (DUF218 family)